MPPMLHSVPGAAPAHAADIPSVDRVLNAPAVRPLLARYGHAQVTAALRREFDLCRAAAASGTLARSELDDEALCRALGAALEQANAPRLRPVFNLTGT